MVKRSSWYAFPIRKVSMVIFYKYNKVLLLTSSFSWAIFDGYWFSFIALLPAFVVDLFLLGLSIISDLDWALGLALSFSTLSTLGEKNFSKMDDILPTIPVFTTGSSLGT